MEKNMKQIFALLAVLVMSMSSASAQDSMNFRFNLTVSDRATDAVTSTATVDIAATPKNVARYSRMTTASVANEIKSHFGEMELKPVDVSSGFKVQVSYSKAAKPSGPMEAFVEYELLESGMVLSKGAHRISISPGETVVLPTANGTTLSVTAKT